MKVFENPNFEIINYVEADIVTASCSNELPDIDL